jgi:DNA repair exonuclease SbcCD ATPase subunit
VSDEFHDRNTIARSLPIEELEKFNAELAALPAKDRTLQAIATRAAALGIIISVESARSFRNTTLRRHLERMRRRQEKSQRIATHLGDGSGRTLNDANRTILAEKIFDELNADDDATGDDEEPARLDLEKLDTMTKAVQRLGKGFVDAEKLEAQLKIAEARLRELEDKAREREAKAAAARAELQKLRDPKAGLSDDDRAAIVNKVDEILGLA